MTNGSSVGGVMRAIKPKRVSTTIRSYSYYNTWNIMEMPFLNLGEKMELGKMVTKMVTL